ncbi:alpha/beta fold hydrolase [Nonomuraea sediminis]|uniref:alpha/beta fold hydrolase n=1 Tax=Nonomuraea sediminis TaxID=2835864 RepID=UPI00202A27EF|nr:alpha/beta hydrolase [Nonomuraea sediminis]
MIGYQEYGDPAGRPVLFVHGYASSRLNAGWTLTGDLRGLRIVALDRPGYGLSSPTDPSTWVTQVLGLVERLGLGRVAVAGVSLGASSALGLAAARPSLVTGVTLLAGMPPVPRDRRWTPASRTDALYWWLAGRAPWLLRRLCSWSARAMVSLQNPVIAAARVARELPDADRQVFLQLMGTAGGPNRFAADASEAVRQGGAAMAEDLIRHLEPWPFAITDVRAPVHLLHGTEDPKVPVELVRDFAATLPSATATYLSGGHFAAFADQEALLKLLAGP